MGLKSRWLDGRLTVNASVFYMEWKDFQAAASFGSDQPFWLSGTINSGGAETTGLEASIQWQVTDRLHFATSLTYGNAEYQDDFCNDFVNGVNQGCVVDSNGNATFADGSPPDIRAGMDMPGAPEKRAFASLTYDIPDVLGGDLWLYYDITYSSEIWNANDEIRDGDVAGLAPGWTFSSFSAGLQLPNQLDITVNVNNLFDQNGYSYVWRGEADSAAAFGDARYQQQRAQWRPRTVWLTLTKGFGGT